MVLLLMKKLFSTKSRCKYYLKCHLVIVTKYRRNLINEEISESLKRIFLEISSSSDFLVEEVESDVNHFHLLISYPPNISVTAVVRKLKQLSTVSLWKYYPNYLSQHYWGKKVLWSSGYFVCSIGDANEDRIREYIRTQ